MIFCSWIVALSITCTTYALHTFTSALKLMLLAVYQKLRLMDCSHYWTHLISPQLISTELTVGLALTDIFTSYHLSGINLLYRISAASIKRSLGSLRVSMLKKCHCIVCTIMFNCLTALFFCNKVHPSSQYELESMWAVNVISDVSTTATQPV